MTINSLLSLGTATLFGTAYVAFVALKKAKEAYD
jgi:hypothetical protein